MVTLAVLQPSYLPWLGYFEMIDRSDIFVLYDDVAFDKNGWRNRNRIKTAQGVHWLSVPVYQRGRHGQSIQDTEIDNQRPWARKHLLTLRQAYSNATYRSVMLDHFGPLLEQRWDNLLELNISMIRKATQIMGIDTKIMRSSDTAIQGSRSERLLKIALHYGATTFLSTDAAQSYLDVGIFTENHINVVWQNYQHPIYNQLHGPFVSHLSVLDLLFNEGERSLPILRRPRLKI